MTKLFVTKNYVSGRFFVENFIIDAYDYIMKETNVSDIINAINEMFDRGGHLLFETKYSRDLSMTDLVNKKRKEK